MTRKLFVLLFIASVAHAQVTIGPITASGAPGQIVDFPVVFGGPANTNGISFNLIYSDAAALIYRPATDTARLNCTLAEGRDPRISLTAIFLPGKVAFTALGFDLSTGPIPFGDSGVLGSCQFAIAADAPAGPVPLPCDPLGSTASDVTGANLTVACHAGTLDIFVPTPTETATPADTPTNSPRNTATRTAVPVDTTTPVPADTATAVPVDTETPVDTPTGTPTETPEPAATDTPMPLATETAPPGPSATVVVSTLQQLIAVIEASGLPEDETNALTATLYAAIDQVAKDHITPACNQIGAFLNKVAAANERLTTDQVKAFVDGARAVRAQLGCERQR